MLDRQMVLATEQLTIERLYLGGHLSNLTNPVLRVRPHLLLYGSVFNDHSLHALSEIPNWCFKLMGVDLHLELAPCDLA